MNKNELLTLTDEQVEQVIAAENPLDCLPIRPCPQVTTLACGEEGPICSAC
jgi:hypothetical protein